VPRLAGRPEVRSGVHLATVRVSSRIDTMRYSLSINDRDALIWLRFGSTFQATEKFIEIRDELEAPTRTH
jgi:hypothetical protein